MLNEPVSLMQMVGALFVVGEILVLGMKKS